jgi:prepilin-type N-terminal cleavage/methylation domain-containing protein
MNIRTRHSRGFTIIELLVVIVLIVILAALIILTYSGVRAKNRNADRQKDINALQAQLESFHAVYSRYPTLNDLTREDWRKQNMKNLPVDGLEDPTWTKKITACTKEGKAVPSAAPTASCYSYQVVGSAGSACDDITIDCAHYTLTAVFEGGDKYVKSSLN